MPAYLPSIPAAKWSFAFRRFEYHRVAREDDASLFWVSVPPFGRPSYRFKERRWSFVD